MTKPILKIDAQRRLGDMLIAKLEPLADLLLFKLELIAVQAAGWLRAGTLAFTDDELARMARVPEADFARLIAQLVAIGKVARADDGTWYMPELVKSAELSETRKVSGSLGGKASQQQVAKRRPPPRQYDLLEQNAKGDDNTNNSIAYGGKTAAAPRINNKYIYNKNKTGGEVVDIREGYYFAHGCIKLSKKHYREWEEKFPFVDLDRFLAERAEWLNNQGAEARNNWFISTQRALAGANKRFAPDWAREEGGAA